MEIKSRFCFPEYNVDLLDYEKDKFIIIERILERGSLSEVRNLLKIYGVENIKNFVKKNGIKRLSRKSLNFWLTVLDIKEKRKLMRKKQENPYWKF